MDEGAAASGGRPESAIPNRSASFLRVLESPNGARHPGQATCAIARGYGTASFHSAIGTSGPGRPPSMGARPCGQCPHAGRGSTLEAVQRASAESRAGRHRQRRAIGWRRESGGILRQWQRDWVTGENEADREVAGNTLLAIAPVRQTDSPMGCEAPAGPIPLEGGRHPAAPARPSRHRPGSDLQPERSYSPRCPLDLLRCGTAQRPCPGGIARLQASASMQSQIVLHALPIAPSGPAPPGATCPGRVRRGPRRAFPQPSLFPSVFSIPR
jgi:hypothetical protein